MHYYVCKEQYEVMKNGIIQTGRFGLDGKV